MCATGIGAVVAAGAAATGALSTITAVVGAIAANGGTLIAGAAAGGIRFCCRKMGRKQFY